MDSRHQERTRGTIEKVQIKMQVIARCVSRHIPQETVTSDSGTVTDLWKIDVKSRSSMATRSSDNGEETYPGNQLIVWHSICYD
jgi:hypothetical protein